MMQQAIKNWWENLLDRERQLITAGGIVVGILFIYGVIWNPLADAVQDRQTQVTTQQQLLQYLQRAAHRVQQFKAAGIQVGAASDANLLSLIEETLSQQTLSGFLKQVNQPKKNEVVLTFENVPFDKLMQWAQTLNTTHGATITQLSAKRLSVIGTANVTVTLSVS